jgi:YggT family protein
VQWLFGILYLLVLLFVIAMLIRLVLDWILHFARDYKPRGVVLVLAEAVYTVTDPPLKTLRRVIPPLRIGGMALDLAFLVLMILSAIVLNVLAALAS